jgi:hypothetical protein
MSTKHRYFLIFFPSYFLKVYLRQSSKIKSQKEVTKNSGNQGFSKFSGTGSVLIITDPDLDPGGPKTYGSTTLGQTQKNRCLLQGFTPSHAGQRVKIFKKGKRREGETK